MIMTRMTLHVHRLRHVAVDALVSGALRAVKTVRLRRDDRRIRESTLRVAAHAELVARQEGFHAVHVMAVHAAHARVMHAAAHEAGELVVLIPDLPVRVICVAVIDDGELVVIEKGLARHEIARELAAPRVTARAIVQMLIAGPRGECGIALLARMRGLPLVVCLHRPVAGFTAHRHLRHRGFVAILGHIVVFAQARVVATRAHLIPHHAATGPVAPLARLAVFRAIDIEPITFVRIETGLHRLQTAATAIHEDLPQRIVTNHALHFVRRDFSAKAQRCHDVVRALFRRRGALRAMREGLLRHKGRLIELRVRFPLRETVVRGLPLRVFIRMAARAGLGARVLSEDGLFIRHHIRLRRFDGRHRHLRGLFAARSHQQRQGSGREDAPAWWLRQKNHARDVSRVSPEATTTPPAQKDRWQKQRRALHTPPHLQNSNTHHARHHLGLRLLRTL